MSKALELTGDTEVEETVKFTAIFDKFFDALNVSNFTDGVHKRKPFQLPYRSKEDFRLKVNKLFIVCVPVTRYCLLFSYSGWRKNSYRIWTSGKGV